MDGNRFDDITRRIASDSSRRSFLKRSLAAAAGIAGLGQVAGSSAARRPSPTPKPVSCPGMQIWNGSACMCPDGSSNCGPDCCPHGQAECCDNACCYGSCYGEELCCPTPRVPCNGVCLDVGVCCTDSDCGSGLSCDQGECVCVPIDTCESLGIACGPASDNCGNPLDCGLCVCVPDTCESLGIACGPASDNCDGSLSCGECDPPYICEQGICTCADNLSCDGKCGVISGQCGSAIDCGSDCGTCQVCTGNTCQPAKAGTDCSHGCTKAVCTGDGSCFDIHPIDCPPAAYCFDYACVVDATGPTCQMVPQNQGGSCTPEAPCQTGVCTNGNCVGTPIQCPICHACTTSTCEPTTGDSCGVGFRCYEGGCYADPGPNDLLDEASVTVMCAGARCEHACCPGENGKAVCCASMDDCFLNGGSGFPYIAFCCAPEDKCGPDGLECCADTMSCDDDPNCPGPDCICSSTAIRGWRR